MKNDKSKISNQAYEIRSAAKHLNVPEWVIHFAKYSTGTNDRETVYKWIEDNKGYSIYVTISSMEDIKEFLESIDAYKNKNGAYIYSATNGDQINLLYILKEYDAFKKEATS